MLSACERSETIGQQIGFLSSDGATMQIIESELDARGIPYNIGEDGTFYLNAEYRQELDNVQLIANSLTRTNRAELTNDLRVRDYLVSLLERDNIHYSIEETDAGFIVIWYSPEESSLADYTAELSEFRNELGN